MPDYPEYKTALLSGEHDMQDTENKDDLNIILYIQYLKQTGSRMRQRFADRLVADDCLVGLTGEGNLSEAEMLNHLANEHSAPEEVLQLVSVTVASYRGARKEDAERRARNAQRSRRTLYHGVVEAEPTDSYYKD